MSEEEVNPYQTESNVCVGLLQHMTQGMFNTDLVTH